MKNTLLLIGIVVSCALYLLVIGGCSTTPTAPVYEALPEVDTGHVSVVVPPGIDAGEHVSVLTIDGVDYTVSSGLFRVEATGTAVVLGGVLYLGAPSAGCSYSGEYSGTLVVPLPDGVWRVDIGPLRLLEGDTARPVRVTCERG